ncbi:MAG: ExeA family protein [Lacipirellulaceae bacterium]
MYLHHWGLGASPFTASLVEPYPTEPLAEGAARADYLVSQRRRLGVLVGGRGMGKTTALAAIGAEQRGKGVGVAAIDAAALTSRELLWRVAEGLGASPDGADNQVRLWRRVEDRLAENRWQGRPTLLVIDDAHELGPDSLQVLTRLARLEGESTVGWTLVLAATPDGVGRLGDALLHLVDLRIDLAPWSLDDTVGYLQTALIDAGRLDPVFTDAALARLHELSHGVPRMAVRLADFALLAGASQRSSRIDAKLIDRAFAETRWAAAPAA